MTREQFQRVRNMSKEEYRQWIYSVSKVEVDEFVAEALAEIDLNE